MDVPMWAWNEAWLPEPGGESAELPSPLRVLTQNLWFDAHRREARLAGHLAQWQEWRPHVIAVQEATLAMLRPLWESPWLRQFYRCTASPDSPSSSHGVVVFTCVPPRSVQILPLPGSMGRRLLCLDWNGLRLGAVHLESTGSAGPVRAEQLRAIFQHLRQRPDSLLVGDCNFCSSSAENTAVEPDFLDVWPELHPQDPGYTMDTAVNAMLQRQIRRDKAVRYDRALLRSQIWRATDLKRVGTPPLEPELWASDHFGLVLNLQRW